MSGAPPVAGDPAGVPAARMPPRLTLLTDFGTADGYVAAMKGVIATLCPGAIVDDASHDIAPGHIHGGAWAMGGYWHLYPPGTVHVAVVDPGVGTARRPLAVRADGHYFVAPDNGVLSYVLRHASGWEARAIANPAFQRPRVAPTFHGRDVFAPAAACLAAGRPFEDVGPAAGDPLQLDVLRAQRRGGRIRGAVIHCDRFGNLVTNVPADWLPTGPRVRMAGRDVPLCRTYADVGNGELLALVGSRGLLEVSVRDGSAARLLGAGEATPVTVEAGPRAGAG